MAQAEHENKVYFIFAAAEINFEMYWQFLRDEETYYHFSNVFIMFGDSLRSLFSTLRDYCYLSLLSYKFNNYIRKLNFIT